MSRGLGKTQKAILEILEEEGGSCPLASIAFELWWRNKDIFQDKETAYFSASRACSGLEKRGLIEKSKEFIEGRHQAIEHGDVFPTRVIKLVKR